MIEDFKTAMVGISTTKDPERVIDLLFEARKANRITDAQYRQLADMAAERIEYLRSRKT